MKRSPLALNADNGNSRRHRALARAACLAAGMVWLAMAVPALLNRFYTADDLGGFHTPLRAFYAAQLQRGEPFDWMPSLYCGFYLTGEGQLGGYHPFHLAIYRWLPFQTALATEWLASYPLAFAGCWWLFSRHLGRRDTAAFGALAFTFSSFNLLHFIHPNAVAVVAHLPWLLVAINVLLTSPRRAYAAWAQAALSLLFASQLLLGYPQYVWFSLLAIAAYSAALIAGARPTAAESPRLIMRSSRLLLALALGGLSGAVQWLPTFDAVSAAARLNPSDTFVNANSLSPLNIVQCFAPYVLPHRVVGPSTHELGCYAGAVPLALIAWLLLHRHQLRQKTPVAAAALFALVALLLALGEYGPLYGLQRAIPIVGGFRCPARYLALAQFALAFVAAAGMKLVVEQGSKRHPTATTSRYMLAGPFGISVAVTAALVLLLGADRLPEWWKIAAGPLLMAGATVAVVMAARGVRGAAVALAFLAAFDLGVYGLSYAVYPKTKPLDAYLAQVRRPPAPGGRYLADLMRFDEAGRHTGNQLAILGYNRVDGYLGLEPARRLDYRRLSTLQVAATQWVVRSDKTERVAGLWPFDSYWLAVPNPVSRVRLVAKAQMSQDPARDLEQIKVHAAALVDRKVDLPPGPPGTASLTADRPGRLEIVTEAPARRLLVLADSYHRGWQATIDDEPCEVLRVNGDFLGCIVPAGRHRVALTFAPRSLRWGKAISLLGLVTVAGCLAWPATGAERRRPARPTIEPTIEYQEAAP